MQRLCARRCEQCTQIFPVTNVRLFLLHPVPFALPSGFMMLHSDRIASMCERGGRAHRHPRPADPMADSVEPFDRCGPMESSLSTRAPQAETLRALSKGRPALGCTGVGRAMWHSGRTRRSRDPLSLRSRRRRACLAPGVRLRSPASSCSRARVRRSCRRLAHARRRGKCGCT